MDTASSGLKRIGGPNHVMAFAPDWGGSVPTQGDSRYLIAPRRMTWKDKLDDHDPYSNGLIDAPVSPIPLIRVHTHRRETYVESVSEREHMLIRESAHVDINNICSCPMRMCAR